MSDARVPAQVRQVVFDRARGCCEYCLSQAQFALQSFSVEHIVPRSQAGETSSENLAIACQGCNNHKYTKTQGFDVLTGLTVPLFHPRNQRWEENFAWSEDFTQMIGLTATGRATIEELHLNREGVVNLRRILFGIGEHPPKERKPV